MAFAKAQLAAGDRMPTSGTVFFSLADRDKQVGTRAALRFAELGFSIVATSGTADHLERAGVAVSQRVAKLSAAGGDGAVADGEGADAVALISAGKVDLVVNSPRGRGPRADGAYIRSAAATHQVPLLTTASAALAAANGIADWISTDLSVRSLQEYHEGVRR